MRRLPALLLVVGAIVLGACTTEGLRPSPAAPAVVSPSIFPSESASPLPSASPVASAEPTPLLSVETRGGECAQGACGRLIDVEADGRLHEVIPQDRVVGMVPEALLEALRVEIDQANFALIESRPFTGECPTAFDGQETIYTFHLPTGDEAIATCTVAIDENHPLFRAVAAVMAHAEG